MMQKQSWRPKISVKRSKWMKVMRKNTRKNTWLMKINNKSTNTSKKTMEL